MVNITVYPMPCHAMPWYSSDHRDALLTYILPSYPDSTSAASAGVAVVETDAEYKQKVEALADLLQEQKDKIANIKSLAEDLQGIKLSKPVDGSSSVDGPQMRNALKEARAATEEFGMDSKEAKLA